MPEIVFSPRVRKSPFFDATIEAGATSFSVYNHTYLPFSYGDLEEEYRCLTERVAIWDVACQRQIEVCGRDAAEVAAYVSARDLTGLKPGRAFYAPICDHDGVLINDPVVLRLSADRYWFSIADSDLGLWIKAVAAERGADVRVFEPDVSPLAIQGPLAEPLAIDLFGAELIGSLGFFHHREVCLRDIPLVLCRAGWSKQGGFELFLTDGSRGVELWDLVMAAGQKYGIGAGAPNAAERMEGRLFSYGADNDPHTDPFEAGLGDWVSIDCKHDFIGKSALRERLSKGQTRSLVNVVIKGDESVREQLPIQHPLPLRIWPGSDEAEPIGELRGAVWSPMLGQGLGLALVSTKALALPPPLLTTTHPTPFTLTVIPHPLQSTSPSSKSREAC